jgi:hypothetical protein
MCADSARVQRSKRICLDLSQGGGRSAARVRLGRGSSNLRAFFSSRPIADFPFKFLRLLPRLRSNLVASPSSHTFQAPVYSIARRFVTDPAIGCAITTRSGQTQCVQSGIQPPRGQSARSWSPVQEAPPRTWKPLRNIYFLRPTD